MYLTFIRPHFSVDKTLPNEGHRTKFLFFVINMILRGNLCRISFMRYV
jgi:hypothetical protein